jgi:hypothetical protein
MGRACPARGAGNGELRLLPDQTEVARFNEYYLD